MVRHLVVGGVAGVAVVVLVARLLPVLVGVGQVRRVLLVRVAVTLAEAVCCGVGGVLYSNVLMLSLV